MRPLFVAGRLDVTELCRSTRAVFIPRMGQRSVGCKCAGVAATRDFQQTCGRGSEAFLPGLQVGKEIDVTFVVGQRAPCRRGVGVELSTALDFNSVGVARETDGNRCRNGALREKHQKRERPPRSDHDSRSERNPDTLRLPQASTRQMVFPYSPYWASGGTVRMGPRTTLARVRQRR